MAQNAPTALTVVSASRTSVQLKWNSDSTATGYTLERRTLAGSYAGVKASATATATDSTIDGATTYVYRVKATNGSNISQASNEVTVGPPPAGFNVVSPAPALPGPTSDYGAAPRMVLDANGDPGLAFVYVDPNGDGDYSDSALYFTKWSRLQYKWTTPVRVAIVGAQDRGNLTPISLARDASNDTWGLAYQTGNDSPRIDVAFSTDSGSTWKTVTAYKDPSAYDVQRPSLGLANGSVYLAFYNANTGIRYITGRETADPGGWTKQIVPLLSGYDQANRVSHLALDKNGNPGVVFINDGNGGFAIEFWRPENAPVKVLSRAFGEGDDPDIRLNFFGTQPRVLMAGTLDENFFADYDHSVWSVRSTDNGNTWAAPVAVRSDGNRSLNGPVDLASGSRGQAAAVTENNGGNLDGVQCGEPKLSRSDDLITWKTCGPAPLGHPDFSALYPNVAFAPDDKLYISFETRLGSSDVAPGIVLWREPLQTSMVAPAISPGGVVNGASGQPSVAPGSYASVYGSNFTTAAIAASDVPLPTNLGGVSVTVNGIAAPLFYAGVNQINFQVPYETASGTASVVVNANGLTSNTAQVTVQPAAPGILVYNGDRAVVVNQDGTLNDSNQAAAVGSYITIYMTGAGAGDSAVANGAIAPLTKLVNTRLPVTATVGGKAATVQFAGLVPGLVGIMQVNIVIPDLVANTYPLVITEGGYVSNNPKITVSR